MTSLADPIEAIRGEAQLDAVGPLAGPLGLQPDGASSPAAHLESL